MSDTPQDPFTELLVRDEGHVRVLTLNRPERRNALSRQLSSTLIQALIEADEDEAVRVVIVTGSGERAFCSGADLKDIRAQDDAGIAFKSPFGKAERNIFEVAVELKKPTIAAINGSAVAGGLELALACDLLLAADKAKFGLVEKVVGITPAMGGTQRLALRAGPARAKEFVMTGELYDAATLHAWGVVNRVLPDDGFDDAARAFAQTLADGPTKAHAVTKRLVAEAVEHGARAADALVPEHCGGLFDTEDARNAIASFLSEGPGKATYTGR